MWLVGAGIVTRRRSSRHVKASVRLLIPGWVNRVVKAVAGCRKTRCGGKQMQNPGLMSFTQSTCMACLALLFRLSKLQGQTCSVAEPSLPAFGRPRCHKLPTRCGGDRIHLIAASEQQQARMMTRRRHKSKFCVRCRRALL